MIEHFLAQCAGSFSIEKHWLLAFFLAGVTGGFTHCLAMCGPLAACDACASAPCGKKKAATEALSLPYHIGRIGTYAALGFTVSFFSSLIAAYRWWPYLSSFMLAAAGLMFLKSCLIPHTRPKSGLLRGITLGFMPCGLLYAALMMAATLPNPFSGLAAMFAF
ncbi:MAG: sulfite exporter TauE/SafE family protein, partial [Rickettsiales bacterium]|nr:sulfite exporter TauE/SafE family protein [Rickettsiales bacterium]